MDPSVTALYDTEELLRDGASIRVRAIRPDDKQRLVEHFESLSEYSVYLRFFNVKRRLSDSELVRLTECDFVKHVALVATLRENGRERIIGVGRYIVEDAAPQRAEVAFAVLDAHQGRGIGTVLLEHLAEIARSAGIREFVADVLGENNRMLRVFEKSGFRVARSIEGGVFHLIFPTDETPEFRDASLTRERRAASESVRAILQPRAVAVVFATDGPGSMGAAVYGKLREGGFRGALHAIPRRGDESGGGSAGPASRALERLEGPVDLVVIDAPMAEVPDWIDASARRGARAVAVLPCGRGAAWDTAARRQLRAQVRASGLRLVGPNALGIVNTDPQIALDATFTAEPVPAGNVGMLTQSNALGVVALRRARRRGLGVSSFVAPGDKADVSGNDLLSFWADDPRTRVIALYLESFGNPRHFARLAPVVAREKPLVIVELGAAARGRRRVESEAELAGVDVAVDGLLHDAGVLRTQTLDEMLDVVALLASQPLPRGPGIGVLTNTGAPGGALAAACATAGLSVARLSAATVEALRTSLPDDVAASNPLELPADAPTALYERAMELVGADEQVDSIVAVGVPVFGRAPAELASAVAAGAGRVPAEKPVLAVLPLVDPSTGELHQGPRGRLPCYELPENAVQALCAVQRYARWRERPSGTTLDLSPFAREAVRAIVERAGAERDGRSWLGTADTAAVLGAIGIACASAEECSVADAGEVAERIGFPLVAKAIVPGLVHKSDVGGVILGLTDGAAVRLAAPLLEERMAARGHTLRGILLQRQVADGIEASVGLRTDPVFGPLVILGLGGSLVELVGDVAVRLPPLTDVGANEMIDRLRTRPLLAGYRGGPPADREALVSILLRVSALALAAPEIREVELNPVKLLRPGEGAVVVDARIRLATTEELAEPP